MDQIKEKKARNGYNCNSSRTLIKEVQIPEHTRTEKGNDLQLNYRNVSVFLTLKETHKRRLCTITKGNL